MGACGPQRIANIEEVGRRGLRPRRVGESDGRQLGVDAERGQDVPDMGANCRDADAERARDCARLETTGEKLQNLALARRQLLHLRRHGRVRLGGRRGAE